MAFTGVLTVQLEIIEAATGGTGGRTTTHRTGTVKAATCDRQNLQEYIISNDVSAVSLAMSPLGINSAVASNLLTFVMADNPVDVTVNTSGTALCNVQLITGTWTQSAIFVTTGSNATRIVMGVMGGSGAAIAVNLL